MKKLKKLFVVLLMLGVLPMTALAADIERLPNSEEFNDVVERCEQRIVKDINDLSGFSENKAVKGFTADQIDWTQAYAVYKDEGDIFTIFESKEPTMQEVKQNLSRFWILPIRCAGIKINVVLDKGQLIDRSLKDEIIAESGEEAWEQLLDDENNWCPESYMDSEETGEDLNEVAQLAQAKDATQVIWLAGSKRVNSALIISDNGNTCQIMPVSITDNMQMMTVDESSVQKQENDGKLAEHQVYTFKQAAGVLENYVAPPTENENGEILYTGIGNDISETVATKNDTMPLMALIILSGCGCFVYGVFRTKKQM